jgi:hypothetical protein
MEHSHGDRNDPATNRFMARSALSFDFMAVTPFDEPPQLRAHAAPLWMWRATQVNFVRHLRLVIRADERRRVKAVRQT